MTNMMELIKRISSDLDEIELIKSRVERDANIFMNAFTGAYVSFVDMEEVKHYGIIEFVTEDGLFAYIRTDENNQYVVKLERITGPAYDSVV